MLPDESTFPLRGDELRNWLRTSGQGIFREFDTGAEALDFLRLQGAAIRTADFYEIRRQVLSVDLYTDRLLNFDDNSLVPAAWHVTDHGLDLSEDFMYRFAVIGQDPQSGETLTKYFAISSDRQLSAGEAKDALGAMIIGEEDFYDIQVESIDLYAALARPGTFG